MPPPNQPFYRDAHLVVDLRGRLVILDSQILTLTRMEYRVLALLAQHPGEAVPRAILLMRIRGHVPELSPRRVDIHIRRLRRKLGVYAEHYIETVFGVGYRFRPALPRS